MDYDNLDIKNYLGGTFISAKNFKVGDKIEAKVVEFQGFRDAPNGQKAPVFTITIGNETYLFRVNKTNARFLLQKGLRIWTELVGKTLTLLVLQTQKGNSFSIIDLK